MKNIRAVQHIHIYLFLLELRICPRLSCKGECTLSIFIYLHKSQGCEIILIQKHPFCIYFFSLKNRTEEFSIHVFSGFSDKGSMCTESAGCNRNIGRCPTRISSIKHLSVLVDILRCKIDQDLTKGCDIVDRSLRCIVGIRKKILFEQLKQDFFTFPVVICVDMQLTFRELRHT